MAGASANRAYPGPFEYKLEESRGPEHGAIKPYMLEPVASESEEIGESDHDKSEVEEQWDNTNWYD